MVNAKEQMMGRWFFEFCHVMKGDVDQAIVRSITGETQTDLGTGRPNLEGFSVWKVKGDLVGTIRTWRVVIP